VSIATRGKWSGRTSGTLIFCVALATVVAVAQKAAGSGADEADELWRFEGPNIAKVAQFTAKQQATVLFTVDGLVGYATAGTARRLDLPRGGSGCANLNPALSHDGRLVAFITGEEAGNCRIAIFEIASGKVRPLIDLKSDPGQLPWSWDDSEIAVFSLVTLRSVRSGCFDKGRIGSDHSAIQSTGGPWPAVRLSRPF
jgi:hypothetical protein